MELAPTTQVQNETKHSSPVGKVTLLAFSISIALLTACTTDLAKPTLNTYSTTYAVVNGQPKYIYCSVGSGNTAFHTCPTITPKTPVAAIEENVKTETTTHWLRTDEGLQKVVSTKVISVEDAGENIPADTLAASGVPVPSPLPVPNSPEKPQPTVQITAMASTKEDEIKLAGDKLAELNDFEKIPDEHDADSQTQSVEEDVVASPQGEVKESPEQVKSVVPSNVSSVIEKPVADTLEKEVSFQNQSVFTDTPVAAPQQPVSLDSDVSKSTPESSNTNLTNASQKALSIYFGFASYEITPDQLKDVVSKLKLDPGKKIVITGFTDDIGPKHINEALALRRAMSVMQVLIRMGVKDDQIIVNGCAMCGMDTNKTLTLEDRKLNRRADIVLVG